MLLAVNASGWVTKAALHGHSHNARGDGACQLHERWQPRVTARFVLAMVVIALAVMPRGHAYAGDSAESLVRGTTAEVLAAIAKDDGLAQDRQRLYGFVNNIVLPHFDFSAMSRSVLGKHWRSASEGQREAFTDAFRQLLVTTYTSAMLAYRGQAIDVAAGTSDGDRATVTMTISRAGAPSIPIVYVMGKQGAAWKVLDVTVDGVSLVINYRSAFGAEVRKSGIDGLIKQITTHTNART